MQISLNSITKVFGSLTALDSVSAVFEQGRIYVLVGPNGAGKTTLLRIIAGLLRPTSGRVLFDIADAGLGVMMEETYLYLDLTPRENLELYAKLCNTPRNRIDEVSALLELNGFMNREVAALSHGQKQRVSLARALLADPSVLILDEPFLGLDTVSVGHVRNFLEQFRQDGGIALIATHELDIVKGIADETLLLESGRIKYFGKFNA